MRGGKREAILFKRKGGKQDGYTICQAQADYIIALKGTQGSLYETVKDSFSLKGSSYYPDIYRAKDETNADHRHIEERSIKVIPEKALRNQIESRWKNLASLARTTYARTEKSQVTTESRYFKSGSRSLASRKLFVLEFRRYFYGSSLSDT